MVLQNALKTDFACEDVRRFGVLRTKYRIRGIVPYINEVGEKWIKILKFILGERKPPRGEEKAA